MEVVLILVSFSYSRGVRSAHLVYLVVLEHSKSATRWFYFYLTGFHRRTLLDFVCPFVLDVVFLKVTKQFWWLNILIPVIVMTYMKRSSENCSTQGFLTNTSLFNQFFLIQQKSQVSSRRWML